MSSSDPHASPGGARHADPVLGAVPVRDGEPWLDPCVLLDKLGEGATAVVFRARHANLGIPVAVKVLKPGACDETTLLRFQREARIAASIHDDRLVRVFDVRSAGSLHYLVMELVDGPSTRRLQHEVGSLPPAVACWIVEQAALGLSVAHARGIVHRDVKPDNILLDSKGGVKLADLGLARPMTGEWSLTAKDLAVGTPAYMAPEQWHDEQVGCPADVFGLGASLFALLTGSSPVEGCSPLVIAERVMQRACLDPTEKRADCPSALAAIVRRATASRPGDRHPDAGAMAAALLDARLRELRVDDRAARAELCALLRRAPILAGRPASASSGRSATTIVAEATKPTRAAARTAGPELRSARSPVWPRLILGVAISCGGAVVVAWSRDEASEPMTPVSVRATADAIEAPADPAPPAPDGSNTLPPRGSAESPSGGAATSPAAPIDHSPAVPESGSGADAARAQGTDDPARFVDARSGLEFVRVPAGTFSFGSTPGDPWHTARDLPAREAGIERAFYLSRTEVTAAQFARYRDRPRSSDADPLPIVQVTHDEAIGFCQQFGYRLPSEVEWERACRAGTATRFSWGDGEDRAAEHANGLCATAVGPRPPRAAFPRDDGFVGLAPVAQLQPNAYGLCDMLGNAWEWCADPAVVKPGAVARFVARGGSFREGPDGCRCSSRLEIAANYRADNLGFRVALDDWRTACSLTPTVR